MRVSAIGTILAIACNASASWAAGAASKPDNPSTTEAVRAALTRWNEALATGDKETVSPMLLDDGSPDAQNVKILLHSIMSEVKMMMALDEVFGKGTTPVAELIAKQEADAKKDLESSKIRISGETAEVTSTSGNTRLLALRDGKWKVDFVGTQRRNKSPIPPKDLVDREEAQSRVYDALIPEILAKKFKTFDEFKTEIEKRMNALPGLPQVTRQKTDYTQSTLEAVSMALTAFQEDNHRFPTTDEGLSALLKSPPALTGTWQGPYWKDKGPPTDGWDNPVLYENPNATQLKDLILFSAGPDAKKGTADDIKATNK